MSLKTELKKIKPKKNTVTRSISLPEEDDKKVEEYLEKNKMQRSALFQAMVKNFLEEIKG